jgi:hypothetical protein
MIFAVTLRMFHIMRQQSSGKNSPVHQRARTGLHVTQKKCCRQDKKMFGIPSGILVIVRDYNSLQVSIFSDDGECPWKVTLMKVFLLEKSAVKV